jgi:starch-binding outer membrane protein, SusD/RagB family
MGAEMQFIASLQYLQKTTSNMKSYLIIIVLIFSAFMAGCDLQELPKDTATKDAVFQSQNGLDLYVNSFYNMLPTSNDIFTGDAMSDYGARSSVPDFIRKDAYTAYTTSGWDWGNLRNINYFIQNCTYPGISGDIRANYMGLARFFRAWFYFDKVKRFGDVPWYNKALAISDSDLYKARDPRTLVMDSVLADINYACQYISTASKGEPTRSLVTREIAYAFKSRICLFEGTFRKYHTEYGLTATANAWLSDAADAAQQVMSGSTFSLNTAQGTDNSYRQLFISQAPQAAEIMLSNICSATLGVYNDANWWYTSATYGVRFSFIRTFINTYLNIDGTPFTDNAGYATMVFADEVKNRDKRLQQTIRVGSYKRINGGVEQAAPPLFSYTYTGYQPIKWCLDDITYDGGALNINSVCIFRYAEVLLNYAEAKAELGTLTDNDWTKTIGALRSRAGITGGLNAKPTLADPYLQAKYFTDIADPSILEIRRERGIELALEGFRFYDLVRWKHGELLTMEWNGFYVPALDVPMDLNGDGVLDVCFYTVAPSDASKIAGVSYINIAPAISSGINPQQLSHGTYGELTWLNNVPRTWADKLYLYPIPASEILLNPSLEQNTGW